MKVVTFLQHSVIWQSSIAVANILFIGGTTDYRKRYVNAESQTHNPKDEAHSDNSHNINQ